MPSLVCSSKVIVSLAADKTGRMREYLQTLTEVAGQLFKQLNCVATTKDWSVVERSLSPKLVPIL